MRLIPALCLIMLAATPAGLAAQDLRSGVVLHWTFDEMNGAQAADAGGGDFHARLGEPGSWSWTPGILGGALRLAGRGTVATLPLKSPLLPNQSVWTVAAWVRTTRASGVVIAQGQIDLDHYALGLLDGHAAYDVSMGRPGGWQVKSRTRVDDGKWHHIAGVRSDPKTIRIYVDGAHEASLETDGGFSIDGEGAVTFGSFGGQLPFAGDVDDLRVYRRALSPVDIRALVALGEKARRAAAKAARARAALKVDIKQMIAQLGRDPSVDDLLAVIEAMLAQDRHPPQPPPKKRMPPKPLQGKRKSAKPGKTSGGPSPAQPPALKR